MPPKTLAGLLAEESHHVTRWHKPLVCDFAQEFVDRPVGPLTRERAISGLATSPTNTGAGLLTPERVALPLALGTAASRVLTL